MKKLSCRSTRTLRTVTRRKRALVSVHIRMGLYGNLAWAGGLVLYAAAISWLYPTISAVEGMGDYLDAMPEQFRELAGVSDLTQALDEQGFFYV